MALLLVVQRVVNAVSPDNSGRPQTWPIRARITLIPKKFDGDASPQKGSPANGPGTWRVATQYSQKTPKNNGLLALWVTEFRAGAVDFAGFPATFGAIWPRWGNGTRSDCGASASQPACSSSTI
ncbi:hypothetical protein MTX20_11480 [Bradyrhizobium sp. ISRA435]|nr:hypothetical protein MTX20_11480 [Bradyrhizobium sp. ISRA435]